MAFFEDLTKKTKDLAYVAADKAKDVAAVAADKAKDAAELEDYLGSLDRRLHHIGLTRRHLEATLLRMTGQGKIGGC